MATTAGHSSATSSRAKFQLTLWAWERPEDLRFLAGTHVRVAFLDRAVLLTSGQIDTHLRRQPLRVAPETPLVAVVRVETRGMAPGTGRAPEVARQIADAALVPRVEAVQIDFDARKSDRPFYAAVLREVRQMVSPPMRISVTALGSWCADDPWIDTRNVDEVVPMLFQMGGDARRIVTRLREDAHWPVSACDGAMGLATDETWSGLPPARSIYVFNPRPWRAEDLSPWLTNSLE